MIGTAYDEDVPMCEYLDVRLAVLEKGCWWGDGAFSFWNALGIQSNI